MREGGQLLWTLDSPVYPKVIGTNRLQTPSAGQGVGEWALGWAWMHALASAALAVWPAQVLGLSVVLPSRPLQDVVTVATLSLSNVGTWPLSTGREAAHTHVGTWSSSSSAHGFGDCFPLLSKLQK